MSEPRRVVPACSQAPLGASCCCCKFCEMGGCDVRVVGCGCCLHARCCPVAMNNLLSECPICRLPATILQIMPMAFQEIDHAKTQASMLSISDKRGKKRKNATIARLTDNVMIAASEAAPDDESSDLRTGRWTQEETDFCDMLITLFSEGKLPLLEKTKLNDFLSGMLKSKQSRLSKKMKNARLSLRQYNCIVGYIPDLQEAIALSKLETEFFASIKCPLERSEIRFHMQKEWREHFTAYCANIGQKVDADAWLTSVEELDRRISEQKDAARMVRRKVMMGQALSRDAVNSVQRGIHIEVEPGTTDAHMKNGRTVSDDVNLGSVEDIELERHIRNPITEYAAPFLSKIVQFIKRHSFPFEHVDVWVPSMVSESGVGTTSLETNQKCRLCFAGCATVESKMPPEGSNSVPLSPEERFNLMSFGEYSEKFSFEVGCGLPGRVYSSGVASWEQNIQKANITQFERCGGAMQWNIQTVLGIPVPSPNVGRVVVVFYSVHDRPQNHAIVHRMSEDLRKLTPTPKWKLVVDVGVGSPPRSPFISDEEAMLQSKLLDLIQKFTPNDKNSPLAQYLPGFTSIRLLLLKGDRSPVDEELIKTVVRCYSSYKKVGRGDEEIASLVAREFMMLSKGNDQNACQKTKQQNTIGSSDPFGAFSLQTTVQKLGQQSDGIHSSKSSVSNAWMGNFSSAIYSSQTGALRSKVDEIAGFSIGPPLEDTIGLGSLGVSPALPPMSSENSNSLAPLTLTASQLTALLQNDAALNFPDN